MRFAVRHQSFKIEKKEVKNISKIWSRKESEIIGEINKIAGLSLTTDKIICYLDGSTTHGYYGGRTITLGIKNSHGIFKPQTGTRSKAAGTEPSSSVKGGISKDDALMVIAHELFHIFYWRKIKKLGLTKSSPGNESRNEWALAEVCAFLLTNEPTLKKYWPKAQVHLYPEVKDVFMKVKRFWKVGNFNEFVRKSYEMIS
jgi:hypothetical protein